MWCNITRFCVYIGEQAYEATLRAKQQAVIERILIPQAASYGYVQKILDLF